MMGYATRKVEIGITRDLKPRLGRMPEPDPAVAPLVVKAFHHLEGTLRGRSAAHTRAEGEAAGPA